VDDGPNAVFQTIQSGLSDLHEVTGLPWWATIATTTLAVRASLLPLVVYQMHASTRFFKVQPQFMHLYSLLQQTLKKMETEPFRAKADKCKLCYRGFQSVWRKGDCHPLKLFATPIVHIPLFLTFIFSVRDMIRNTRVDGLTDGGALWFTDLTAADASGAMTLIAVSLTYLNLELAFGANKGQGGLWM